MTTIHEHLDRRAILTKAGVASAALLASGVALGATAPAAALWLRIVGATHVAAAPTAAFRMKRRRSSRDPSSLVPRSRPVPRM